MRSLADSSDRTAILSRLQALRPDTRRGWGRMTAPQVVCHLSDAFRVPLGEIVVSYNAHLFNRTVLKWIAIYLPLPWPPGIQTRPEMDQCRGAGTKPGDFERDVAELEALIEKVTAPTTRLEGRPHPLFGPLSHAEWLRWGYLHMDHHLRQFGV
jgi:uncharacterized protein DUF1569